MLYMLLTIINAIIVVFLSHAYILAIPSSTVLQSYVIYAVYIHSIVVLYFSEELSSGQKC